MERRVILKALVGSHNYNLNTSESDKDYKAFVLPTFEDLYKGDMFSEQIIGENEDVDTHDIRKLVNLFFKSNINFLEILYSKNISMTFSKELKKVFDLKDELVKINLPHLFNACGGMHLNKMKQLYKGTEGTQHLVDKFGYDTKQALHAYRVLNFIDRFAQSDFTDFKEAITYTGEDRDFMLSIKHGEFDAENFENFVKFYHESRFQGLKEKYHSIKPNLELKEELEKTIMNLVKNNLLTTNY
ncbi:nucleotidyltransferase [Bacillus phage vB_BcoS-136]|uniref:Putative nucleotidyltransferase n=1 Tax=Bacillus phage vB_BcoS-136 TaxID=2419619 RepID=A0A3G3BVQ6_9CAUD|nr:nucleotidyltransferase [Bacillus phage vB_BcoS-136]AYP68327.1 putative nucleotidyltransferase [Bacillus phage vB_BcoS-136]